MTEDTDPHPEDPYGIAKLAVELELSKEISSTSTKKKAPSSSRRIDHFLITAVNIGQTTHVLDTAQSQFQLVALAGQSQLFTLCKPLCATGKQFFQFTQTLD